MTTVQWGHTILVLMLTFPADMAAARVLPTPQRSITTTTPAISLSVSCYGNPERTWIKNNSTRTITLHSLGSIYNRGTKEPLSIGYRLGAGKSVTYQTGSRASVNVLTRGFIYDSYVGTSEGSQVVTSVGTFSARCVYISGYFPLSPGSATKTQLAGLLPGTRRTEHFTVHYRPRSFGQHNSGIFAQDAEAAVTHIESRLALTWYGRDDYYLSYGITPQPNPGLRGLARCGYRTIYERHDGVGSRFDRQYIAAHETTHQIACDNIGAAASVPHSAVESASFDNNRGLRCV